MSITLRVHVSQACIDTGVREDKTRCPLAQAIRAARPDASFVSVDGVIQFVAESANWRGYHTFETRSFLQDFDDGVSANPFEAILTFKQEYPL